MKTGKIPYPSFYEVMNHYFRNQVIDSYDYAVNNVPLFAHPKDLFQYLKFRTTYLNDPSGNELFQSFQTMMDDNYHGISGAGDCDCFTIAALASMKAQGWNDLRIYLAGKNPKFPQHIYAGILFEGKEYVFDLTNPYFDQQRKYPYRQKLVV